jgi:hypothetical protein
MPRSRCSSRSCQTVLPEHEHTVLSSVVNMISMVSTSSDDACPSVEKHKSLTVPDACAPCDDAYERVRVVLIKLRNVMPDCLHGVVERDSPFHLAVSQPRCFCQSSPKCVSVCPRRLHQHRLFLPRLCQRCLDKACLLSWPEELPR